MTLECTQAYFSSKNTEREERSLVPLVLKHHILGWCVGGNNISFFYEFLRFVKTFFK